MLNIMQDDIHMYQPTTFCDLGKDRHSKHGYNWAKGNVLLEIARKDLLKEMPKPQNEKSLDFRNSVNNECFWRIFKDLNKPLNNSGELNIDEAYSDLIGADYDLNNIIDFAVNSALYTSRRVGAPGYWKGNSILYKELKNPKSVVYNLNGKPCFKERLVNSALWEDLANNKSTNLETIFSQDSAFLDVEFLDVGKKIQKMNSPEGLNSLIGIDFSNLSKGSVIKLGYFLKKLEDSKITNKEEGAQRNVLVRNYLNELDRTDHFGIAYFEEDEVSFLQNLVST